ADPSLCDNARARTSPPAWWWCPLYVLFFSAARARAAHAAETRPTGADPRDADRGQAISRYCHVPCFLADGVISGDCLNPTVPARFGGSAVWIVSLRELS